MFFEKCKFDNLRSKLFTQHLQKKAIFSIFMVKHRKRSRLTWNIENVSIQKFLSVYLRLYRIASV